MGDDKGRHQTMTRVATCSRVGNMIQHAVDVVPAARGDDGDDRTRIPDNNIHLDICRYMEMYIHYGH